MRRNIPARFLTVCLTVLLMARFTPPSADFAGAAARLTDEVVRAAGICTGMVQQAGEELIFHFLLRQDCQ